MMDMTEPEKQQLVDELRDFIRIPSRSSSKGGEECVLQNLIAEKMREAGARVRTFEADDITGFRDHPLCHGPEREYAGRLTVLGELGPADAPALLVLAHSDTVQLFEPDLWSVDPFAAELKNGALYGLGVSDDKWGLATLLFIMRKLARHSTWTKRLIFASTIDEENGVGNGLLLLMLAGVKAEAALYLDGYNMEILIGCLGGSTLFLRPVAPLSPDDLAQDLCALRIGCEQLSRQRSVLFDRPMFRENAMRDCSVQAVSRGVEGGAFLVVMFYTLPDEARAEIATAVEQTVHKALGERTDRYRVTCRAPWFEPALIPTGTPLIGHMSDAVRNVTGISPKISTVSKQDSFVLTNHARIPTVSFGCTGRVSGRGAFHNPDEFLRVEELCIAARIAYGTVTNWLA
jgi:acetylornithine deacetylase/succinyl-diaminopimelate desuccinylase-like protein